MIFQVPMWGYGGLYFKTTKRLLFASLAKNWLHWNLPLQTSFWRIDNIPNQKKSTELISCTKTQRQEKPFPFLIELTWWQDLQNSYGHTAASYAASNKYKAPWWCPCTPCKTNMEPQKLVVSPWNQGFPIVACEPAVSCQGFSTIFGNGACFWSRGWGKLKKTKSHKALGGYSTSLLSSIAEIIF